MTDSEGVVKYRLTYSPGPLPADLDPAGLFRWFERCREAGLIGRDPGRYDGLAYGNISQRVAHGFVISGTQTGGRPALETKDLAWVIEVDPVHNCLGASGPARPSSEAMTHGQIYQSRAEVNAVIHVHAPLLWRNARALDLPLTAASAAYGTPAMAAEVQRLLDASPCAPAGVFAMAGHEDGIVAYGVDMDRTGELLFAILARAGRFA